MKAIKIGALMVMLCGMHLSVYAKENVTDGPRKPKATSGKRAGCAPATAAIDLDVNNVRARVMNGGDAWWDLVSSPRYEVPKVTEVGQVRRHIMFAGALWIGGLENNNLKQAAMTYRQSGSDFFPGPLDVASSEIDATTCKNWDKIYEITREEIDAYRNNPNLMTDAIRDWPAHHYAGGAQRGNSWDYYQAPFKDEDGDLEYHPENGADYPDVFGDQCLWFVYNDKGNNHSETQADPIGLEIQTQAFAFATNDEINDMTFYKSTVINRGSGTLDSTYFGQWVDPDLGYAFDDYVGVDVEKNLGYCYNGDNLDEGVFGYGTNPPSVGVDFFEGPKDANGNEIGLTYFVYYNNDFSTTGNPQTPIHYYYYLTGRWKNGSPITEGGSGFGGTVPTNYMFPGDPSEGVAGGWTELTAGNRPGDRRFLQSSGPFSLKPGARNNVTVGIIFARASSGGATGSLDLLKIASEKAQKLYRNNFELIDGPDAPDVTIRELDKKLVISLENTAGANVEKYAGTVIGTDSAATPITYRFQGYQIYQLASSNVSAAELNQVDRARLVGQVDIKDGIGDVVNRIFDPNVSADIPTKFVSNAEDNGIRHTFELTTDAFASGDNQLVNYRFYYYMVVAYSVADNANEPIQYLAGRRNVVVHTGIPHNPAAEFGGTALKVDYGDGPEITRIAGMGNGGHIMDLTAASELEILQNTRVANVTYQGAKGPVDIKVYDPTALKAGTYELKMVDSVIEAGTGGVATNRILSQTTTPSNIYQRSYIPTTRWTLTDSLTGEVINAETVLTEANEQLLFKVSGVAPNEIRVPLGIAITTKQPYIPGTNWIEQNNGFLEATMEFANPSNRWLTGVQDVDHNTQLGEGVPTPQNWIRSGRYGNLGAPNPVVDDVSIDTGIGGTGRIHIDPGQNWEGLLDGIIAPAAMVARAGAGQSNSTTLGPLPSYLTYGLIRLHEVSSVDLVFTADKSKWSTCMVVEMGEADGLNQGGVAKFGIRAHDGWLGEIGPDGKPIYSSDPANRGKSLFPGYAINLETGERLNVFFSEDSHLSSENGNDMIWNPTDNFVNPSAGYLDYVGRYLWGGKHYIYIMNSFGGQFAAQTGSRARAYDGCEELRRELSRTNLPQFDRISLMSPVMWVMEPMLAENYRLKSLADGLIPEETRIRLRVSRPYATYDAAGDGFNKGMPVYRFKMDNIAPERNVQAGIDALPLVNITPNPYYAGSLYETSQLDNRVRITNAPSKCVVSIYALDGTLVRQFNKNETASTALETGGRYPSTFIDWDLKNTKGVPVASGMYLIHVDAGELGQKILRWFGVMKPVDLDTF